MFAAGIEAVVAIADKLTLDVIYRGEYLAKPKHNILCYNRIPNNNIILFDINDQFENYRTPNFKQFEAKRLGFEFVPVLFQGKVSSPEDLYKLLENESVLGGQKVEGIVAKNYSRFGTDGKALMGKFVREDFRETHAKEWKADENNHVVERLIATLRNEKRWEKAIFHLRDAGKLESSPRDIGSLMKAVQEDIKAEEIEFIKQKLLESALPKILRASVSGLPEWYKKRLLEGAFENVQNS